MREREAQDALEFYLMDRRKPLVGFLGRIIWRFYLQWMDFERCWKWLEEGTLAGKLLNEIQGPAWISGTEV